MDDFEKDVWALRPRLKGFAVRLCRNVDDADDLVGDTITRALEHRGKFTPGTNLLGWMGAILFNRFCVLHRRSQRIIYTDAPDYASMLVAADDPERRLMVLDGFAALRRLSPGIREAVVLAGIGVGQHDGARTLGIHETTFRTRTKRGRDRLKQMELI